MNVLIIFIIILILVILLSNKTEHFSNGCKYKYPLLKYETVDLSKRFNNLRY